MVNNGKYSALPELEIHIGKKLRTRRKKLLMTLTEAAKYLGISQQQLQKYEQAQNRLSVSLLYRLAQLYNLSPLYFYQGFKEKLQHNYNLPDVMENNKKRTLNILFDGT